MRLDKAASAVERVSRVLDYVISRGADGQQSQHVAGWAGR